MSYDQMEKGIDRFVDATIPVLFWLVIICSVLTIGAQIYHYFKG